jgi:hypothetical protein
MRRSTPTLLELILTFAFTLLSDFWFNAMARCLKRSKGFTMESYFFLKDSKTGQTVIG